MVGRLVALAEGSALLRLFWNIIGAAVLALLLVRWAWVWLALESPVILPAAREVSSDDAEHLFGMDAAGQAIPQANLNLIGVFTGPKGFAIFEVDGIRQVGVPLGGEILPGIKLLALAGDHAMVGVAGAQQRVDLKGAH